MPELNSAPADSVVDGSEKLLTTAFEYLTVDQIRDHTLAASVKTETASYTAALGDLVVQMNVASANNFTVPPNSSVAFPIGAFLEVWQSGPGQTTIVAGSGVTILYDAEDTLKLKGQNAGCSLRKVDSDTWRLIGKMEAA